MSGFVGPVATGAIVATLHFVLAAGVTIHVLETKRDPAASVGWIGLAWLSPVLGSVLYLLLGINRLRRRAAAVRGALTAGRAVPPWLRPSRDDHLAPLERAGLFISGRPVVGPNAIKLLQNGDAAYPEMLAAIDGAAATIGLSSYIFRADDAGQSFINALVRARRRGVEVRVLIDGYGGGYLSSGAYRALRREGIMAARFMHSALPWRMPFLNLRTHRKILVVDGRVAFSGGLNIGNENLISRHSRHPVLDVHFRVAGPVVTQLGEAFADQWGFATGEVLSGPVWFPPVEPTGDSLARTITSGPDYDLEKIELLILEAISCARSSIKIMTPYFLPDDRIITGLLLAAMRGVVVDVVLPAHSNHTAVDWATRAQIGPLLSAGCRVWTHLPPFDHSKLLTVDDIWCFVGSANWDARSFRLNFEINLEVYRSAIVQEVSAIIAAKQSTQITSTDLRARSVLIRCRDSAARLFLPYL